MGIRKWLIKRGFGGIGDSARTIAKVYRDVATTYPDWPEEAVFAATLKVRRDHIKKKFPELELYSDEDSCFNDARFAFGSLSNLILAELVLEYPILEDVRRNDPDLYAEVEEIVEDSLEEVGVS